MKKKNMHDNYKVCHHRYSGVLKMTPLLSTETEENGHSSVNINNDSSACHATRKGKIFTRFSFSFPYKQQQYCKLFCTFKFKLK